MLSPVSCSDYKIVLSTLAAAIIIVICIVKMLALMC